MTLPPIDHGCHVRAHARGAGHLLLAERIVGGELVRPLGGPRQVLHQLHVPHRLAGAGVERDQARVDRAHVHLAIGHRHAAVRRAAAHLVGAPLVGVAPQLPARLRVQRDDVVEGQRNVHHAVGDDGRGLEGRRHAALVDPCRPQMRDVAGVDLPQRGEALVAVVTAVGQPVGAIRARAEQPLIVDAPRLPVNAERGRHQQSTYQDAGPHALSPSFLGPGGKGTEKSDSAHGALPLRI